jgi:hypothetical protein
MIEQIREMCEAGLSAKRIAHKLKLEHKEVQDIIKENQFSLKKEIFTDDEIPRIVQLYIEGVSAKSLGKKYSIDKRRVQRWANNQNVLRAKGEANRLVKFNEHYFDIVTVDMAYWLGFFYADVYNSQSVNTVVLALQTRDRPHLEKLATVLQLPLEKITYSKVDKYAHNTLKMYSKYMCEKLTELGCPQGKSFLIKYPGWLPAELNNHFIRGLFDGDGCLTFREKQREWKWSLMSTKEVCEAIHNIFIEKIGVNVPVWYSSDTGNNTYILVTSGNEKIAKIMKWLYANSTDDIRLTRKYEKYERLAEQQKNRNINRPNYLLTEEQKQQIAICKDPMSEITARYQIHEKTVYQIRKKYSVLES